MFYIVMRSEKESRTTRYTGVGWAVRSRDKQTDSQQNLLMPRDLIVEAINQGVDSVEKLAEKFEVSRSAMSICLEIPFETGPDHEVDE